MREEPQEKSPTGRAHVAAVSSTTSARAPRESSSSCRHGSRHGSRSSRSRRGGVGRIISAAPASCSNGAACGAQPGTRRRRGGRREVSIFLFPSFLLLLFPASSVLVGLFCAAGARHRRDRRRPTHHSPGRAGGRGAAPRGKGPWPSRSAAGAGPERTALRPPPPPRLGATGPGAKGVSGRAGGVGWRAWRGAGRGARPVLVLYLTKCTCPPASLTRFPSRTTRRGRARCSTRPATCRVRVGRAPIFLAESAARPSVSASAATSRPLPPHHPTAVIDCYRQWCGPCKAVVSTFKRIYFDLGDRPLKVRRRRTSVWACGSPPPSPYPGAKYFTSLAPPLDGNTASSTRPTRTKSRRWRSTALAASPSSCFTRFVGIVRAAHFFIMPSPRAEVAIRVQRRHALKSGFCRSYQIRTRIAGS